MSLPKPGVIFNSIVRSTSPPMESSTSTLRENEGPTALMTSRSRARSSTGSPPFTLTLTCSIALKVFPSASIVLLSRKI